MDEKRDNILRIDIYSYKFCFYTREKFIIYNQYRKRIISKRIVANKK